MLTLLVNPLLPSKPIGEQTLGCFGANSGTSSAAPTPLDTASALQTGKCPAHNAQRMARPLLAETSARSLHTHCLHTAPSTFLTPLHLLLPSPYRLRHPFLQPPPAPLPPLVPAPSLPLHSEPADAALRPVSPAGRAAGWPTGWREPATRNMESMTDVSTSCVGSARQQGMEAEDICCMHLVGPQAVHQVHHIAKDHHYILHLCSEWRDVMWAALHARGLQHRAVVIHPSRVKHLDNPHAWRAYALGLATSRLSSSRMLATSSR